ncbi:Ger(x)C family spore germination protein [Bacillus horti]|uniref:Ger(X)C family germination protein n=1 Tax=Caldalkalibacillus horti TaxID=77523 RepID=A0ABT9VTP3_9BACI|nr:Ger(x)C family spore germination protein [Bacillus horti]MDQ0164356.1 Ger(x)C family germination protein [Bacillus horti]
MIRRTILVISIFLSVSIASGCWDQQLLQDVTMITSIGIDKGKDGKITYTVVGRNIQERAVSPERLQVISTVGTTPSDAKANIDRKIPEVMSAAKSRILMFNDELAREPIYPVLDIFYRDPKQALNAKFAIVDGSTLQLLNRKYSDKPQVVDYAVDLIASEEEATGVNISNIQMICPVLFDPGQDAVVPYLSASENEIIIMGLALFNDQVMTGTINPSEATLFLLLNNQLEKKAYINQRITEERSPDILNFVSINVLKSKAKLKVHVSPDNQISADVNVTLKVDVLEYPHDKLDTKEEISKMAEILTDKLTDQAKVVINKLQEANCDSLGIGRRLIAYHNDTWQKITWKDVYPDITITPKVQVEIIRHGIIN